MNLWSVQSGAARPTEWIGCLGWLALMGGVVAWLRGVGAGGAPAGSPPPWCSWPASPPVWLCVQSYFHPQDLLAMGLCLGALACALRDRWIGAGILVALAVLSQQFALLVAAPLLVLAPGRRRVSYAAAAVVTGALVDLPCSRSSGSHALAGHHHRDREHSLGGRHGAVGVAPVRRTGRAGHARGRPSRPRSRCRGGSPDASAAPRSGRPR